MKSLALAAAVALLTIAAPVAFAADEPSLGASVRGQVITDEDPVEWVVNRGTIPTVFTFDAPDGWVVVPASLTLQPGERGEVTLTGDGDSGKLVITGTGLGASGMDTGSIAFGNVDVMSTRPFDPARYVPAVGLALLLITSAVLVARRLRRYSFHIERKAS